VHRDFGDSPRRFVGGFCREWATLVEEWAVRTGDGIVRLPDVRFAIVDFTEDLPLSTYSFCRPRQTKWRVEWLPADRPFPPDFVAFITSHPNAGTVRHFLRHDLYPEQFPDRSAR
jgi:hypothetical protein